MKQEDGKEIEIIIAANKVDLPPSMVEFKDWEAQGRNLAKESSSPFFATSAKTGTNIEKVFQKMAELIIESSKKGGDVPPPKPEDDSGGGCCVCM